MSLSISNASPIQFWLIGDESFNQKEVCSIYPVCFCQQINLSDDLYLDIYDADDLVYHLLIYKDDGSLWNDFAFSQTFDHHQYLRIRGSSGDWDSVENNKLIFKIVQYLTGNLIAPSSWTDDVNTWTSKTATQFLFSDAAFPYKQFGNYMALVVNAGYTLNLTIAVDFTGGVSNTGKLLLYLKNGSGVCSNIYDAGVITPGSHTYTISLTATDTSTRLYMESGPYDTGSGAIVFNVTPTLAYTINTNTVLAQSDCVEITDTDQNCTELITYSNSSPFAGLVFITPASVDILAYTSSTPGDTVSSGSSSIIGTGGFTGTKGMSIGFNWTVNVTAFNCVCRLKITVEQLSGVITTDLYTQSFTTTGSISGSLFFFQITHDITNIKYVLEYVSGAGTTTADVTVSVGNWQNFTYNLRIPAVFYDEQYPQEQEDLELSDDTIITLWSKIEGKKLLDIGYMPFYMHKKLQFALMMDNVTIDGTDYRMRDPYQITSPSSKRSALRRSQVLLSEKDFINRNLL